MCHCFAHMTGFEVGHLIRVFAMDRLDSMRLFVRVAKTGGFRRAAVHSRMSTGAVSRAIMELESQLRTRLFNRTTRHVCLTESGRRYLQRCERILEDLEHAETEAANSAVTPFGRLRVHASTSVGQHHLILLVNRYMKQFANVSVDLVFAECVPDLIDENLDIAIAVTSELEDSSLVSQGVGVVRSILCASADYLARRGTPASIMDLQHHRCLQFSRSDRSLVPWVFDEPMSDIAVPSQPADFSVNAPSAMVDAIRAGMGIGVLPLAIALSGLRNGTLMEVLPCCRLHSEKAYALYGSRRYLDAKIQTFVEFLKRELPLGLDQQYREPEVRTVLQRGPIRILSNGAPCV